MKKCCKNVKLTKEFITPVIWSCLKTKLRRKEYAKYISKYSDMGWRRIRREGNFENLSGAISLIADEILGMIEQRCITLPPVRYRTITDGLNGKTREIGIESVAQQILEHIAVVAFDELWRRKFMPHQYASIKGKGQLQGIRQIRRWAIKGFKYYVKLDIRHCYPSINRDMLMRQLRHDVKNNELIWFVGELLNHHRRGLLAPEEDINGIIIGSWLSANLCNYIMSYGLRIVSNMHYARRGKLIKNIKNCLSYMDDFLFTGDNIKAIAQGIKRFRKWTESIGLELKEWTIKSIRAEPIHMMGYRIFSSGRFKISKKIFLRASRSFRRYQKSQTIKQARRVCSYYGYFKTAKIKRIGDISVVMIKTIAALQISKEGNTCFI